jgi:hypothetical protein
MHGAGSMKKTEITCLPVGDNLKPKQNETTETIDLLIEEQLKHY